MKLSRTLKAKIQLTHDVEDRTSIRVKHVKSFIKPSLQLHCDIFQLLKMDSFQLDADQGDNGIVTKIWIISFINFS